MTRKKKQADNVEDTTLPLKLKTVAQSKAARKAAREAWRELAGQYASPGRVTEEASDLPVGVRAGQVGTLSTYTLHDGETATTFVCDLQPFDEDALSALSSHLDALRVSRRP